MHYCVKQNLLLFFFVVCIVIKLSDELSKLHIYIKFAVCKENPSRILKPKELVSVRKTI